MYETNSVWLGVSLQMLMENAGKSLADVVSTRLGDLHDRNITVFVGKGGNGGDGLVAARHLVSRGASANVVLLYKKSEIRNKPALVNLEIIEKLAETLPEKIRILSIADLQGLKSLDSDVLIDAMLGTGIRGRPREPLMTAIELFNNSKGLKVAVDTPSGLNPDTGDTAGGVAVKADITVTMHYVKPGLLKEEAREYVGELIVAEIGIPLAAEVLVGPGDVKYMLPEKPSDAHKGIGGRVLIIGGSSMYAGAPALAGLAALRTGSDLAFVAAPESIADVIASFSPNLIVHGVSGERFSPEHIEDVLGILGRTRATTVVVGPGMGLANDTKAFTIELLRRLVLDDNIYGVVVDADALKHLSSEKMDLRGKAVLTPHAGELGIILGVEKPLGAKAREQMALNASTKYNAVVLLKGVVDYICWKDKCRRNITGNRGMSTGGTGDVLSGIIAALIARRVDPFEAACIAAFINGVAGDMAYEEYGERLVATDLLDKIPKVIKKYKEWDAV